MLLYAKGIAKAYGTGRARCVALRRLSLAFPSQGLVAIKGKSGCGKSTLLNLLSGLERPSCGTVYFRGKPILSQKGVLGKHIGIVFQHYNLLEEETVFRNVLLPSSFYRSNPRKAKTLLKTYGLLPLKGRKAKTLSGGEKQRVAICRALLNDPEVLFADEPTGALDQANAEIVMKALKSISKTRLVILVSHNEELISSYADYQIELSEGRMLRNDLSSLSHSRDSHKGKREHRSGRWSFHFALVNIKRNAFKNLMCLLSGSLGFAALLQGIGYVVGNIPAMEKEQVRSLTYTYGTLSEETSIEIPGSAWTLIKNSRPEKEVAEEYLLPFPGSALVPDYSYFFPSSMPFSVGNENHEPCSFQLIEDITLGKWNPQWIAMGYAPKERSLESAVANVEFFEKYGWGLLGSTIHLEMTSVVTFEGKRNEVRLSLDWKLEAAVREFGFLNTPKVYGSYPDLAQEIENYEVEGEAGYLKLGEVLEKCAPDSPYTSYRYGVFFADASIMPQVFSFMETQGNGSLVLDCPSYAVRKSFLSLSEAFVSSLGIFICIVFLGVILILAMNAYSSFNASKKQSAVLLSLGAKYSHVLRIYVLESLLIALVSAFLPFVFSPLLQGFLNDLLRKKFDVSGLISIPYASFLGVPFLLPLLYFSLALSLGFLSSYVPLRCSKRFSLASELRDE